jgi:hypothetical protein
MDMDSITSLDQEYVAGTYGRFPLELVSGKGCMVTDSQGKEYSKTVLFGSNYSFYLGLICVHYGLYKTDKDIPKYIKMHIDDGLEIMSQELSENPNLNGLEYLIDKIDSGLDHFFKYEGR